MKRKYKVLEKEILCFQSYLFSYNLCWLQKHHISRLLIRRRWLNEVKMETNLILKQIFSIF